MELKPALTIEEQIDHLINKHNLIINNTEEAKTILNKVSYYRLSAYGIGLKQKDDRENYAEGISIEHIYKLYVFDSEFRNILIHIIEQLEISLRTCISNHLALKYGADGYMDINNFNDRITKEGESIHKHILEKFEQEVDRQQKLPFVMHHIKEYNRRFPIWVAVELFSFGNLSSLYSVMKDEDKKEISKRYNTTPDHLGSWILSLLEVRNICAHYNRLYNMPLKQKPFLYKENSKYGNGKQTKVFVVILTIKRMLGDCEEWESCFKKLQCLFQKYTNEIKLSYIGFPNNWIEVLS